MSTDVVVLEVSSSLAQPSLFYHLGVRESFSMTNNVLLCSQTELPGLQALRVSGQRGGRDRCRVRLGFGLPRMPVSDCLLQEDVFQKNSVSRIYCSCYVL